MLSLSQKVLHLIISFKGWHPCGVHLKYIYIKSHISTYKKCGGFKKQSCNNFKTADGLPPPWDDEPAIFFVWLGKSEHMSWQFLWTVDCLDILLRLVVLGVYALYKWELYSHDLFIKLWSYSEQLLALMLVQSFRSSNQNPEVYIPVQTQPL